MRKKAASYHSAIIWATTRKIPRDSRINDMSILTRNHAMSHSAVIYGRLGIIDNHQLWFIKVPLIIDYEMIADSHHY